ncbi:hypothetical protein KXQ82_02520 [Mucilaginibacter sp. HMF5004]|uniref:hypothetical protein n=1 Tax=Mucilaginibacter rivuli TaxID=2857527 RepID=UPI001C5DA311|nr:hypothetical protein [Mucilaginibacter rivuli]MBW4888566.1 hypothetical protein [Mucilaginibacter rivuli]
MKKINIIISSLCILALASCKIGGLEMQKDFQYVSGNELHGEINKTASQYLQDRGKTPIIPNDTVFKYMQLGLEYAGIDLAEYTKPGRTYIFLSNNSIRVLPTTTVTVNGKPVVTTTSNIPTAGFWFDFPIMDKNPDGTQKFAADGVTPVTHPAKAWSDYSVATVRNYFLYLIGQADVGFNNANYVNTSLASLLPAGAVAGKESKMGYLVVNSTPMLNASGARVLVYNYTTGGNGFDLEGKFNIKFGSGDFTPLVINDNTNVATGGLIATNGQIHVCATTVYPSRY